MGAQGIKRRQVPRRGYESSLGLLWMGEYTLEQSYQISEGGLMFDSKRELKEGNVLVISINIPNFRLVVVRGIVRSVVPTSGKLPVRYGLEFQNLEFSAKREIRNFVAAATRLESQMSGGL